MAEKPKHLHSGHRQRVKDEFRARGLEGWPDHRVLELLLFYTIPQGDVNGLAHDLIDRFGSLAGVLDASEDELRKVPGVGEHTSLLLQLIPAVGARYREQRSDLGELVQTPREAAALLEPYFFGARNEMVYILCLDGKCKLLGMRRSPRAASHRLGHRHPSRWWGGHGPAGGGHLPGPQPRERPGLALGRGLAGHRCHSGCPGPGGAGISSTTWCLWTGMRCP